MKETEKEKKIRKNLQISKKKGKEKENLILEDLIHLKKL